MLADGLGRLGDDGGERHGGLGGARISLRKREGENRVSGILESYMVLSLGWGQAGDSAQLNPGRREVSRGSWLERPKLVFLSLCNGTRYLAMVCAAKSVIFSGTRTS